MAPEIQILAPNTWSLAQFQEYFSDDAHFAETLQQNGEEVRKRMAELFSTLSSSLQSSISFPPRGLNEEQIERIFIAAQNAGLFSCSQLAQPNGHLLFDSFVEVCQRKPSLAVPFILSGLPVSEEGFELIFKNNLRGPLEAIVEARVALTPQNLKRLIHCACRVQSSAAIQPLLARNLSPKYWEYALQQCCLEGDQRAASFLLQKVPFTLPPLFHALILGKCEASVNRAILLERFPLTGQTPFQLATAFKNDEIASFLWQQSLMPLTISDGGGRMEEFSISYIALASRCDVLKDMLLEAGILIEENYDAFLNLLAYLHTGTLKKEEEHFDALLAVADKYGITGLKEVFQEWFQEICEHNPERERRIAELKIPSPPPPPEIVFELEDSQLLASYTEEDLLKKYREGQKLRKDEFVKACTSQWMGFLKCALTEEWIRQFDDDADPLLLIAFDNAFRNSAFEMELVRLLLKRGASPLVKLNKNRHLAPGSTYLHYWGMGQWGSDSYIPFMQAILNAVPRWMRKEFVNHQNEKGETALELAADNNDSERPLKLLLEAGADPWEVCSNESEFGGTILHMLAAFMRLRIIRCLLASIPPERLREYVNLQDNNGDTALHRVFENAEEGSHQEKELDFIETFLRAGADLFIKNKEGITPLARPFSLYIFQTYAAIPMFRLLLPEQKQRLSDLAATLYPDDGVRGDDTPLHTFCKTADVTNFSEEESFVAANILDPKFSLTKDFVRTFDPAMAFQRNREGLLPLQIAILNGATHLIGALCGVEKLAQFKEFVKQIEAQDDAR